MFFDFTMHVKCAFQTFYNAGDYIIRQGARGDTFFIINKGKVSRYVDISRRETTIIYIVVAVL